MNRTKGIARRIISRTGFRVLCALLTTTIAPGMAPAGALAGETITLPSVAELLERIEALEKEMADMRKNTPAACGSAEPATRSGGFVAVKRAPAREETAADGGTARPAESTTPVATGRTFKPTAGYEDGFFLSSADGDYKLELKGHIQADSRFFVDDGSSEDVDQFSIRRARLDLQGRLARRFNFRLMPDFAGDSTSLDDAYVEAKFAPWLELRSGKFKTPFGIERLQSSKDVPFVERALTDNLIPGRDIGVRVRGEAWNDRIDYAVAVLNGVPDGSSGDEDLNDSVDVAARVFVKPYHGSTYSILRGAGLGIAATYGREQGNSSDEQLPTFETSGSSTFFRYEEDGDDAVAAGGHYRVSPQATWFEGPFGLLTEYVLSSQQVERDDIRGWVENEAWQIRTSWMLTGEDASMKGIEPDSPFNFGDGQWGAWELALRWSSLDVDGEAFRKEFADPAESARTADALATAVNWYLNRNVVFYLHYEHTMFGGGDGSGDRDSEDVFLTRMQVVF